MASHTGWMRTVLRPAADSPDRDEAWRETISRTFGGLDVRLNEGPHERDQLVTGQVGPLSIIESRTGPGESRRQRPGGRDERLALYLQGEGETVAQQRGRSDRYRNGDLGLVDLTQPFQCRYTDRRVVLVTFPYALSPLRHDDVARVLGNRIAGDDNTATLLGGLVRRLPQQLEAEHEATGARVASAILDLLHAVVAHRVGRESTIDRETRRRLLLLQCRAFIEQHLGDPALSPAMVAAAHHVSVRHLHQVFENSGDTVAGLIRRRRLDRCRTDLLDPALAARPASAVGARWGFTEPANFSRAFKRAFGLPPAAFRVEFGQVG
jgi:AraC-like DNA-binding protein